LLSIHVSSFYLASCKIIRQPAFAYRAKDRTVTTLDVEEYEGDGGEMSRNKRSVTTDESECLVGEVGAMGENMGEIVFRKEESPFLRY